MYTQSELDKALSNLPKGTTIDLRGDIMVARLPSRQEELASRLASAALQSIPSIPRPVRLGSILISLILGA